MRFPTALRFRDLESIAGLRQRMEFEEPRTFKLATGSSFSKRQSRTGRLLSGLGISQRPLSSSSGQKRKRRGDTSSTRPKRARSESSCRRLNSTGLVREQDDRSEEANVSSIEQPNATCLRPRSLKQSSGYESRRWGRRILLCRLFLSMEA